MDHLYIDFETYSDLDLAKTGPDRYLEHPSAYPVCLGYRINSNPTKIWTYGAELPLDLVSHLSSSNTRVYGFGPFDYHALCVFSEIFPHAGIHRYQDVSSLCARYRFPQNLKDAGAALGCNTKKMEIGKVSIRKCCQPGGNPEPGDYQNLYEYCQADVDVMAEIVDRLPGDSFTAEEQWLWRLTYKMNRTGVPVDRASTEKIVVYLQSYVKQLVDGLSYCTGEKITTPNQTQRMREWLSAEGVELPNMQADTIKEVLDKDEKAPFLSEVGRYILQVRFLAGSSSVKKFLTILEREHNGRVHDNLNHHGAGTGRWAGRGLQYHNLPRASVEDFGYKEPESLINKFVNFEPLDNPVGQAKALIRPMVCAPEGYKLIVSDFSSIELRVLLWLAGQEDQLDLLRNGECIYSHMAAAIFKKDISEIKKPSPEYNRGKATILGSGYQMGAKKYHSLNPHLTAQEAEADINAFRTKNPMVEKMWDNYSQAAQYATQAPGHPVTVGKVEFQVLVDKRGRQWLRITLPSSRRLIYADPGYHDGPYGRQFGYLGVNPTTRKMERRKLTPGLITENIVQAVARDLLANGKLMIEKYMQEVKLCISVHDEAGGQIADEDITEETMKTFDDLLCSLPEWAEGLPLKAKGYISQRYKKD